MDKKYHDKICESCAAQICTDAAMAGGCLLIKWLRNELEAANATLQGKDDAIAELRAELEAANEKIVDCEARSMSENFAMVTMQTELEASQTAESQLASVSTEQVEIIWQLQDELEAANARINDLEKELEISNRTCRELRSCM